MTKQLGLTFCAVMATAAASAVSTNSIDTFDNDSEGWVVGAAGVNPTQSNDLSFDNQPGFLSHFSDGAGPNGKWLMWSQQSDWTGDYVAAGVDKVSLWADGRTGDDTILWLGFDGPGGWFFTPGQFIVTADEFKRFEFDVAPDSLIYRSESGGTGVAADTMSDVGRFEIFTGPGPVSFKGAGDILEGGVSSNIIWMDNIAALPEPSSIVLLSGVALAALMNRRRAL